MSETSDRLIVDRLDSLLNESLEKFKDRIALEEPSGATSTYRELDLLSRRYRDELLQKRLKRGDLVGILAGKSIATVASIFGVLRAGAAYVPVNPTAPPARNNGIIEDCSVAAVVVHRDLMDGFLSACRPDSFSEPTAIGEMFLMFRKDKSRRGGDESGEPAKSTAYILYTSGSTGKPKGVVHTHCSAMSFVNWCARTFEPDRDDRFASHAPFYFDLSILDLYLPLTCGAALILIDDALGKSPMPLAEIIAERKITNWYSTPSILTMMARFGHMERHDYSALKTVLFAGEVFPVNHLRMLHEIWPGPAKYNLFGPTETNVCTFYKIPSEIPEGRQEPFPIGKNCDNDRVKVVDDAGAEVKTGALGELLVSGGTVMQGYFGMPKENAACFVEDENSIRWYKTGDMVKELENGDYVFVGRRDRMVKKRGFRIELGEIEAALLTHEKVAEAAVLSRPDEENGTLIEAFASTSTGEILSTLEMKVFLSKALPIYMVPDRFHYLRSLPKTPTDKTDYQALKNMSMPQDCLTGHGR